MLETTPSLVLVSKPLPNSAGLGQLFSAAVVNKEFRRLLLNDPQTALQMGYLGNSFALSGEEEALIVSIRADSLPDLAKQVTKALDHQL